MNRKPRIEKPKVFISYAWTSDSYVKKVAGFANMLIDVGIEVLFDKYEVKPGNELNDFMEKSVKDETVTGVLILLNEEYQKKADARIGGVGKETQILSEELYNHVDQTKIIPIIFERNDEGKECKPKYLGSTCFVDLTDEASYDENFRLLCKAIYGEDEYVKPELGATPTWITEPVLIQSENFVKYKSIKAQNNGEIAKQQFKDCLNDLKERIKEYNTGTNGELLEKYNELRVFRDEYLELVKNGFYVKDFDRHIATFFDDIHSCQLDSTMYNKELKDIMLQEMFIYTIAFFIKNSKFESAAYCLGKTYNNSISKDGFASYKCLYCTNFEKLAQAVRTHDGKEYIDAIGTLWVNSINIDFCTCDEFILADLILYNYTLFGKNFGLRLHWYPHTYIYGNSFYGKEVLLYFAKKLQTSEFLENAFILFNFEQLLEFKNKYREVENNIKSGQISRIINTENFIMANLLCDFTNYEDLGKYR